MKWKEGSQLTSMKKKIDCMITIFIWDRKAKVEKDFQGDRNEKTMVLLEEG